MKKKGWIKNMDNSLKGLILAAGVIITCVVIGLGFYISREAKNTSNNGANQLSSMNSEYQDMSLSIYDGLSISGREVKEVVKKSATTTFSVIVKTGDGQESKYTSISTALPALGSVGYINPDARFLGEITKDSNDVLSSITFTQQ
jgi:hypothetical protein